MEKWILTVTLIISKQELGKRGWLWMQVPMFIPF